VSAASNIIVVVTPDSLAYGLSLCVSRGDISSFEGPRQYAGWSKPRFRICPMGTEEPRILSQKETHAFLFGIMSARKARELKEAAARDKLIGETVPRHQHAGCPLDCEL